MPVKHYADDSELFALMKRELFSCVVGDVMDKMGLLRQYLPPRIRPLAPDMVVAGRAMPVLEADYFSDTVEGPGPLGRKPFGLMLEALDSLKPHEVYIAPAVSGEYAMWGELMSARAQILGAAGTVLDGYARDTRGIIETRFPTFAIGSYGQDQGARGKIVDYRVPIEIGGIRISPGTIVFGDIDGVVTIPRQAEAEVIAKSFEKVRGEAKVAEAIRAGMSTTEAFTKFGVM